MSRPLFLRYAEDEALRARWEAQRTETREAKLQAQAEEVAASVLELGSITEAATRHGDMSRVTVYAHLKRAGLPERMSEIKADQRALVEYAALDGMLELLAEIGRQAADPEGTRLRELAAALGELRKVAQGDDTGKVNVAVATATGAATAGSSTFTRPVPVHEQDLPPHKLHALARAVIEVEAMPDDPADMPDHARLRCCPDGR